MHLCLFIVVCTSLFGDMEINTALLTEGAAREALRSAVDPKVEMDIAELGLVYPTHVAPERIQ